MKMAEVASEKENVVIAAGDCELTLLPQFGGKIASIRVKGRELLQKPLAPIGPRTRTMSFDEGDASGWDECLPSVAACTVPFAGGEAQIPDHGDLWRVEWESGERWVGDCSTHISMKARCYSLPLELERRIALHPTGEHGAALRLEYAIRNVGDAPVPWSWAAHPLFAVDEGDKILLSGTVKELRLEGSRGNRLGKSGDKVNWPIAKLLDQSETDLSIVPAEDSAVGDKLFAGPLGGKQFVCGLVRPKAGVQISVTLDVANTPYLGLWLCFGGWPERPGPKQMCVALEPATAPVDSLAEVGAWSRMLQPGELRHWSMWVEIYPLKN